MKLPRLRRKSPCPRDRGTGQPRPGRSGPAGGDLPQHRPARAGVHGSDGKVSARRQLRQCHPQLVRPNSLRPSRMAAEMLTALFDTARLHGTGIRVQTPPASEDSPFGQELCPAGTSASGRGSVARPIRAWLQRVTTGAARRLSLWTGTWTGVREFLVLSVHSRAAARGIVAGQARVATERASHNPPLMRCSQEPEWTICSWPRCYIFRTSDRSYSSFVSSVGRRTGGIVGPRF
jgi:hypothetical protein